MQSRGKTREERRFSQLGNDSLSLSLFLLLLSNGSFQTDQQINVL